MKKIKRSIYVLSCVILALVACFCMLACEDADKSPSGEPDAANKQFTGITFADKTVTYDGTEKSILISGTLPAGTKVEYEGNKGTDAGEYEATATLSGEGYETKTLKAKLKINKATITGVTFTSKSFVWTGTKHSIEIEGTVPDGVNVVYDNNEATAADVYEATATLSGKNYETLVLHATLTIKSLTNLAKDIVDSLFESTINPWSFLPAALSMENMAYNSDPSLDFTTSFVNVSSIAKRPIGKQMNVLYDGILSTENMLGYVDTVYSVGATIASVYQQYINNNPSNYANFTGSAGGFSVKITLVGNKSVLLAGNSTVSAELSYDADSGARTGRIQITSGAALKYESSDNYLKFAVRVGAVGVSNIKQIEFVREKGAVAGYLREFTGSEGVEALNLKTSAVISSNATHTIITSDKRESDDLIIDGYEEVYSSVTGQLIGGEVQETVKALDYDTFWFNLYDIAAFKTVKVALGETNGLNADTIYINGSSTAFKALRGGIVPGTASRHYDVEMKDVWYIVKNTDGNKTTYQKVKTSIPMLFVQKKDLEKFGSEVVDQNKNTFTTTPILPSTAPMTTYFDVMQNLFLAIKEQVTRDVIEAYIGDKNAFFN